MLGIQETVQKDEVKEQMRLIKREMESTAKFHPDVHSILNVESQALRLELREMLHTIPLSEFLAKSSTTGLMGAAYLVPDKLHADLIGYSVISDIVPLVSAQVVTKWKGADALTVPVVERASMIPRVFSSGGSIPDIEANTKQLTLTPVSYGVTLDIGNDLLEDEKYGLIDWHIRQAAIAMGEYSSDMALTVLKTGTDGWGTVNASAADSAEVKFSGSATKDITSAIRGLNNDMWKANTLVTTPESFAHSIGVFVSSVGWSTATAPSAPGYDCKLADLDVVKSTVPCLHAAGDVVGAAFTRCIVIVFDRNNAMLTARKRWLQVNNYANPVDDIAGATITARQDSVSLYNDAVYVLTEAA